MYVRVVSVASLWWGVAVRCSAVQCVADEVHTHECAMPRRCETYIRVSSVLQCVAVCCSVLQCAAVCCSVLHMAFIHMNAQCHENIKRMYVLLYINVMFASNSGVQKAFCFFKAKPVTI